MVQEIIWSRRAQNDRIEILNYWIKRNKSNTYSKKLNILFEEAVKIISQYPHIGKPTDNLNARIKVVRDYLIIYELDDKDRLIVLTIWDSRQNPSRLESALSK